MGRSTIPKRKRKKKTDDIEQLKKKWTSNSVNSAQLIYLFAVREEFRYGETRMLRLLKRAETIAEDINSGRLTLHDIEKILEEEVGIKFV